MSFNPEPQAYHDSVEAAATCICGTEIVRCTEKHHVSELCEGWRHDLGDPALWHSITCDTKHLQIARPAHEEAL